MCFVLLSLGIVGYCWLFVCVSCNEVFNYVGNFSGVILVVSVMYYVGMLWFFYIVCVFFLVSVFVVVFIWLVDVDYEIVCGGEMLYVESRVGKL